MSASGPTDVDRRARLLAIKLQTLVRERLGIDAADVTTAPFALGAAAAVGDEAWVLLEHAPDGRGLGPALIWASRAGARRLHVVVDDDGVIARRAAEFTLPTSVWRTDGRGLTPVSPVPLGTPPAPEAEHLAFTVDIEAAGATPLVEHGVVTGEVRGLEVCRVVDTDTPDGRVVRLDVGAGVHDREAFAMIHGDVPTREALAGVVATVAQVRDVDSPGHPLNRLAPERFVRWRLEQEPWLVGLASVEPAPPPVPRRNLSDRNPCVALGRRLDSAAVVVVCSVGVDLDLIPYAADARLARAEGEPGVVQPEVIVVVPERDLVPATTEIAALLRQAVTLVSLSAD